MKQTLLKAYIKRGLKRGARLALVGRNLDRRQPEKGRFTRADVDAMLEQTSHNFDELLPTMPPQNTIGSQQNVMIGVLSLAMYRALLAAGVEKEYATELFTDALWKFYEAWMVLPRFIARLRTRDPQKQMNLMLRMFLRYPFNRPGYDFKVLPGSWYPNCAIMPDCNPPGTFALDIYRCPVHDYFRGQGEEELEFFRNSWCTVDFAAAQVLVKGGKYERPHTLSAGDDVCDMRWTVVRPER